MTAHTPSRLRLTAAQRERFGRLQRLEQLHSLDPGEFELFCAYLYEREGYTAYPTGRTGDEGVDVLLQRGGQTTVVQCKRYSGTVGQPTIRDLYGVMMHHRAQGAALVTTGSISDAARRWASDKSIQLIDGHDLISWTRRSHPTLAEGNLVQRAGDWLRRGVNWRLIGGGLLAALLLVCGVLTLASIGRFRERTAANVPTLVAPTLLPTLAMTAPPAATPAPTTALVVAPTATRRPETMTELGVARFDLPPTLDGRLDEWGSWTPVASPFITEQEASWDGSLDIEATWRLGWDQAFFYLGVAVKDDRHVQTQETKFAYLGDSLELQLDTDLSGDYGPQVSPDDFQYVISPGNDADLSAGAFRFQGDTAGRMNDAPGSAAQVAAALAPTGYVLEIAIPWSDLNLTPAAGLQLGVALSVNDNDTPGSRQQELMLSHVPGRLWLDPTSWGIMTLE